jgi:hypothetical protein
LELNTIHSRQVPEGAISQRQLAREHCKVFESTKLSQGLDYAGQVKLVRIGIHMKNL